MKKILLLSFSLLLLSAPFIANRATMNYYDRYEAIAKRYECYPVETCRADFNGDGRLDTFLRVRESNVLNEPLYRLKISVEQDGRPKEILNIPFEHVDNTYRTHIAVAGQPGENKLVVYDTVNKEPYFVWDGERLSPKEPTNLKNSAGAIDEREIRRAMALEDDTGGFNGKIMFRNSDHSLFVFYYLTLFVAVGAYFRFFRRSKTKFS